MKKNLFVIMFLAIMLAVSCGDDTTPSGPNEGDACDGTTTMCVGEVYYWCNNNAWALIDCNATGKVCDVEAGCVAAGTDTNNGDDSTVTDTTGTDTTGTDGTIPANCGNGTTDTGEACDGDAKDCTTLGGGYTGGWASCKADCSGYDTTTCVGGTTDNDTVTDNAMPDNDAVNPTGKTCMEINQCMGDCADEACQQACYDAGSTEGKAQFDALMTCVSNNCATECGSGGTNETCNACASEKCESQMDACFTVDVDAYGTLNANSTAFGYIYDGDGDLNSQIQSNQGGLVLANFFTGTYGLSNKPVPGTGAVQTMALVFHNAAGQNPASLTAMQQSQTQTDIVNPIVQMWFPSDSVTPGQYDMDPTVEGSAGLVLLNAVGEDACLLAYCFSGTTNVTAATNTTAASGGSITFGVTNAKVYYPTETPAGDISGSFTGITICPKE